MNVMLLSNYEQANCWFWCQKCCTWCCYHQMHWPLNVMSELLHPTVKRSDAYWRLSVDEVVRAASDADVIICIDGCLLSKLLHSMLKSSNALTKLFDYQTAAFNRETIRCTLTIVWLTRIKCCWLCVKMWCQMTALDADASNALTKLFDCQTAAFDRETIRCTLTVVCCESSLQLKCNVICDEVEEAKIRCRCNVIRYDVKKIAFDFERSNALTILFEFFVDWKFMRELVHKSDRKKNEKKIEICF